MIPFLFFNVTIQNHSGYTTGYFEDNVVSFEGYNGIYPDLDEYLTLIQKIRCGNILLDRILY